MSADHWRSDIADVPESVSRSMYTSSLRSRKVFQPASAIAFARCSGVVMRSGSTILMR